MDKNKPTRFDFSAEKRWCCAPMPTRALPNSGNNSTGPRPDLCVSFRVDELVPAYVMGSIPGAIRRLMQCEGNEDEQGDRVFPFLTIEAKRSYTTPDAPMALHQSLNCASQALHNMFEFFREAESEDIFYKKVRFFSVAAMSKGIIVRIHRAVLIPTEDSHKRIVDDYPLAFEYEEFVRFQGHNYARQEVVSVFERIIWGYGSVLFEELRNTAEIVAKKFKNNPMLAKDRDDAYYGHRQKAVEYTRTPSNAPSLADTNSIQVANSTEPSRIFDSFQTEAYLQEDLTQDSQSKKRRRN
jgi:hypothetical protein